jgi:SAM-dependent methyltransferase
MHVLGHPGWWVLCGPNSRKITPDRAFCACWNSAGGLRVDDTSYGIGLSNTRSDESTRLSGIEQMLDPGTFRHLDTIGVASGMRCLELGGGGGSVARWMAERVGPSGSVLITDIDVTGLVACDATNIEVRVHDVCTDPLDDSHFDLIHARLLLEHLPSRVSLLNKLVAALRPGGWLLIEDMDLTAWLHLPEERLLCEPKEIRAAYQAVVRVCASIGAWDAEFGRDLPVYLANAGLSRIGSEARAPLVVGGSPQSDFITVSARQLAPVLIDSGAVSQPDLDRLIDAFENPGAILGSYSMVSAWGCRRA